MLATPHIRHSLEELYEIFADYTLSPSAHLYPGPDTGNDEGQMRATPLRDLSADQLREYAESAMLTWGDSRLFRHFLPRILEVFVTTPDPGEFADPCILFSKLRYAKWRTWPSSEQRIVEQYVHDLWDAVLSQEITMMNPDPSLETWICSISQAEEDIGFYLQGWQQAEGMPAALALASLILTSAVIRDSNKGRSEFWVEREAQYAQLKQWVRSPAVKMKLQQAAMRWVDSPVAEWLRSATKLLD